MAVVQMYYHCAPRAEVPVVVKAMIRLLRSHVEVQAVVLTAIAAMSTDRKVSNEFKYSGISSISRTNCSWMSWGYLSVYFLHVWHILISFWIALLMAALYVFFWKRFDFSPAPMLWNGYKKIDVKRLVLPSCVNQSGCYIRTRLHLLLLLSGWWLCYSENCNCCCPFNIAIVKLRAQSE